MDKFLNIYVKNSYIPALYSTPREVTSASFRTTSTSTRGAILRNPRTLSSRSFLHFR